LKDLAAMDNVENKSLPLAESFTQRHWLYVTHTV